jgi:Spx/MgsR family transcriptional regulator
MTSLITVYGIANCDTVKKARTWLSTQGLDYRFHDFKKQGVPSALLTSWMASVGWERLLNRKGTSWRKLDQATQMAVVDSISASALMLVQASVIKRPVVVWADQSVTVGFDASQFAAQALSSTT